MNLRDIITKRRAFRALTEVEIDDKSVLELSTLAGLAPSCFNKQPWRFVFVRDKSKMDKLFESLSKGNAWARRASMIVAVITQRKFDCLVESRDYYLFDTGMATAFLILRATEMGLVAHPIAGFNEEKVKECLAVPEDMKVITLLIIGKQTQNFDDLLSEKQIEIEKKRPERLPVNEIMKFDTFK